MNCINYRFKKCRKNYISYFQHGVYIDIGKGFQYIWCVLFIKSKYIKGNGNFIKYNKILL